MTDKNFDSVVKEVSKVLNKNKVLLANLGKEIEAQLERFSSEMATVEDAKEAAKRFADYFDLNSTFIDQVVIYREDRLSQFNSIHLDDKSGKIYAIKQSDKNITIGERKTSSFKI